MMPLHSAGADARCFAVPAAPGMMPPHVRTGIFASPSRCFCCGGWHAWGCFSALLAVLCRSCVSVIYPKGGNRMETGVSEQIASALPPSSIDAERSVLGAMLQDSGAATLAFETLVPEDFYSAEHKEIFEAMRALHIAGNPVDLMTVGNELTRRGHAGRRGRCALSFAGCALRAHHCQHPHVHPDCAGKIHPASAHLRRPDHSAAVLRPVRFARRRAAQCRAPHL